MPGFAKEATKEEKEEQATRSAQIRNQTGMSCDFERIHWSSVTRKMLEERTVPLIILGVTDSWNARTEWGYDNMLQKHGNEFYQLNKGSNVTMRQVRTASTRPSCSMRSSIARAHHSRRLVPPV